MSLFRQALVVLMLFSLGGIQEAFAAAKPAKAKITQQPVARTAELGQTVQFKVVFSSKTTATCQWRRNKKAISGATATTYIIDTVLPEDAGNYDVVITNAGGATTSRTVLLTVNLAPASLPVDAVIHGDFSLRILGETEQSDGAFVVTGKKTLQDPEAPSDVYTFTYSRQSKNKAGLVIRGRFYDADLGDYITSVETHSLTFTGVSSEGELLATSVLKGTFTPPAGYRPAKLNFTGKGTISIQLEAGASTGGTSVTGATVTVGHINTTIESGLVKMGGAALTLVDPVAQGTTNAGSLVLNSSTVALTGAGLNVFNGSLNSGGGVLTLNTTGLTLNTAGLVTFDAVTLDLSGFDLSMTTVESFVLTTGTSEQTLYLQAVGE
ncbi:MAG: hypothetical protein K0R17_3046 [Rariglobus sp.]|jgi:hypothetical protein|nr:hypothetical protein [Rariglobus sp.]